VKETWAGPDSGDTQSDLAIIRRRTTTPWDGTDNGDYLRINQGSCSEIDRNSLYGRGCVDNACTSSGVLAEMPVNIKWCGTHHFFDLEGSRAMCSGDSGGPYLMRVGNFDTIVGLASNVQGREENACADDGGRQRAVRMNADKLGWLESKMGIECSVAVNVDVPYVRCF
jgi:hypothetical protein